MAVDAAAPGLWRDAAHSPLARTIGGPFVGLQNKPGYAWMFPGVAFCVVVGLCYLHFLVHLPRRSRILFIVAGLAYVGGAVGF